MSEYICMKCSNDTDYYRDDNRNWVCDKCGNKMTHEDDYQAMLEDNCRLEVDSDDDM